MYKNTRNLSFEINCNLLLDTVSRVQVYRMFCAMDAARTVGACVLVKPTRQLIPPLTNMIVMEPRIALPENPMTRPSDSADGTYSGGSWEALVMVDKYVPSLLRQATDAVPQLSEETGICVDNEKLYSGPRITGGGRTGGCGGGTDMDTDDTDESDEEHYEDYDSDTPPVNTTVPLVEGARCPVCDAKFKPCKNARPGCEVRSAKWNLERHAQKKGEDGDASHLSVAEALRAVDPHLANWQIGKVPPGEVRDVSNWVGHTDQEWRSYTGHYNRHMRMPPADRQRALDDRHSGRALRKCIERMTQQWQSGAVQF